MDRHEAVAVMGKIGKPSGNHLTDVAEIESGTALHVVEGYVWCDRLHEVHGDTLNPQGYVEDGKQDYCKPEDHRAMFMDSDDNVKPRWDDREPIEPMPKDNGVYVCNCECHQPMGWRWEASQPRPRPKNFKPCEKCLGVQHMPWEEAGAFAVPEPVRSAPVPLTVRRHTEESRAIWRQNLVNALPADMLPEDRFKIADQLLEVTITMGDELRRKRLIDKLMEIAEVLEDAAERRNAKFGMDVLSGWSNLLVDAAEELRSTL